MDNKPWMVIGQLRPARPATWRSRR